MSQQFSILWACVMLYLLSDSMPAIGSDARTEILAQYEPHATALLDHYKSVRVRYHFRQPSGKDRERLTRVTSVFDRELYRVDGEEWGVAPGGSPTGAGVQSIQLRNSKYQFTVKGDQAKGYVLGTVTPHGDIPSAWSLYTFPFADPWLRRSYLDLLRDPKSAVLEVKHTTRRGHHVVAVTLEYDFVNVQTKVPDRGRAIYSFDPEARWACVGERPVPTRGHTGKVAEAIYKYVTFDGWPVPTREEQWLIPADDSDLGQLRAASIIDEYAPIPELNDANFRLSAFGLPEPLGVEWPKRRSGWLWLVWAGAACAVVMVAFLILRRRATLRQTSPPATSS